MSRLPFGSSRVGLISFDPTTSIEIAVNKEERMSLLAPSALPNESLQVQKQVNSVRVEFQGMNVDLTRFWDQSMQFVG